MSAPENYCNGCNETRCRCDELDHQEEAEQEAFEEAERAIERRGSFSPTLRRLAITTERAARLKLRAHRNRQLEF